MNYYCLSCNKSIEKPGLCAECEQWEIDSRKFAIGSAVGQMPFLINGEPYRVEAYLRECFKAVDPSKFDVEIEIYEENTDNA